MLDKNTVLALVDREEIPKLTRAGWVIYFSKFFSGLQQPPKLSESYKLSFLLELRGINLNDPASMWIGANCFLRWKSMLKMDRSLVMCLGLAINKLRRRRISRRGVVGEMILGDLEQAGSME